MKFTKGFAFTSAFAGLLVTTLLPFMAQAQSSNQNVGVQIPQAVANGAINGWTPERLQNAKPASPVLPGSPRSVAAQSQPQSASPTSGASSGSQTATQAQSLTPAKPAESKQALSYSYPFPYTRYFVRSSNYKNYPERTVGKLFFTKATGGDYVCSASAVNSTNKRLIVTAGHCVSDGQGRFHKNVIFIPAYNPDNANASDREPYGKWSACDLTTTNSWHTKGDFSQDIGMIQACDKSGKKLHDTVGYLGYLANASRNQQWHAFGYPAASPFNGRKMTVCAASFATNDSGSPNTIGIGCDMTGGSSGGPWVVSYNPDTSGAVNYINGVNSYKYGSQPAAMYSPYFGNEFLNLRTFAISRGA